MAKQAINVTIKIDGLKELRLALKRMPDNAKSRLKDTAFELSQKLAKAIRTSIRSNGRQYALLAGTVSTGTARGVDSDMPVVEIGGTARVGRRAKPAYKILFGAEFGATYLHQFKPRNTSGYAIYPTVRDMSGEISESWSKAADEVIAEFEAE